LEVPCIHTGGDLKEGKKPPQERNGRRSQRIKKRGELNHVIQARQVGIEKKSAHPDRRNQEKGIEGRRHMGEL